MPRPKPEQKKPLVGKAPLGSLPADKGQSAASPQHKYQVGDIVFFSTSNNTVAGEAMFLGWLKASPEDLALVSGKQMFEMWEGYCTPTRRGLPAEGKSWRDLYLRKHPASLV